MLKILWNLFTNLVWFLTVESVSRVDFRQLINNLTIFFNTLSIRELIRLSKDIAINKFTDNQYYRFIYAQTTINTRILLNPNNRKLMWLSLVLSVVIYKWTMLLKKLLLWPFKLGIFSFFYSIFGIDMSWFLNIFYFFTINIPQWVYIQYLTLYNNWLGWWQGAVYIKNLKNVSIPSTDLNPVDETVESNPNDLKESNKINKKKNNNYYNYYSYFNRHRYLISLF